LAKDTNLIVPGFSSKREIN